MSVRLFILGVLNEKAAHGYDIKETAAAWNIEQWGDVGFGSIYHALGQLEKQGFIEAVSSGQEGNRPPKTVYAITEAGKAELQALVEESCTRIYEYRDPFNLGIVFIRQLPQDKLKAIYEKRRQLLEEFLDALDKKIAYIKQNMQDPFSVASVTRVKMIHKAELKWLDEFWESIKQ